MRYIKKPATLPESLDEFLRIQLPLRINLDYENGFTRKAQLRGELVDEQFGLCAYTGAALDERLQGHGGENEELRFFPHIEHLKPQSVCRQELLGSGREPGIDLGEDMDYHNMVAALYVEGAFVESFGAAARGTAPFAVWPTQSNCESRFQFFPDGSVRGNDPAAEATIETLRLDHETLRGWRRAAIGVFLDQGATSTRGELEQVLEELDNPGGGRLAEFSFCIASVLRSISG